MEKRKALGNWGEELAVKFLKRQGYCILERNFSCRFGEIDIVAKEKDVIVFVEVRTKNNTEFGFPEETVLQNKKTRLFKTAQFYLCQKKLTEIPCRFDMVSIIFEGKQIQLWKDIL
jgi:putative endonuclease